MIRFGWKRRSDGEPMARVRVEWLLTRDDMAGLLLAKRSPFTHDELTEMAKAEIEQAIRDQLWDNAGEGNFWSDNYAEGYQHGVTQDEAWEWAMRQVKKL